MNNEIPIVLAMNCGSIPLMQPLVDSIFKYMPNAKIYLITDDYPKELYTWIYRMHILQLTCKTNFRNWTKNMYMKMYIDECFPELERCIYLDFDVIVCDDVSNLLDGDDWVLKASEYRPKYFNSGVLAFRFTDECKELLKECRSRITEDTHDEMIFNEVFKDKTHFVDRSYNVLAQPYCDSWDNPKIVHFQGQPKPWNINKRIVEYFKYK